ncbi:MAG: hypothetical protein EXS36_08345 [Pedosphaera sp.]|nr:hypothetical protein [Pedosphaera sp.]
MRDSQSAMGHPSARGWFVHLFLNGLYWGIYNLTERPSASFVAHHFGGSSLNYDSRNADKILLGDSNAWTHLFSLLNAGVSDPSGWDELNRLIDLPAFADFILLNLYGGNADWDRSSNWYAARRRVPPGPFHFFVWDRERTLEFADVDLLSADDDQSPLRLFQILRKNPAFQRILSLQAHKHLSAAGALGASPAAARFPALSRVLETAITAESARWGDYRRFIHPYKTGPFERYTREAHWRPEVQRILRDFFPQAFLGPRGITSTG